MNLPQGPRLFRHRKTHKIIEAELTQVTLHKDTKDEKKVEAFRVLAPDGKIHFMERRFFYDNFEPVIETE